MSQNSISPAAGLQLGLKSPPAPIGQVIRQDRGSTLRGTEGPSFSGVNGTGLGGVR